MSDACFWFENKIFYVLVGRFFGRSVVLLFSLFCVPLQSGEKDWMDGERCLCLFFFFASSSHSLHSISIIVVIDDHHHHHIFKNQSVMTLSLSLSIKE
jgi:hypothetical protein